MKLGTNNCFNNLMETPSKSGERNIFFQNFSAFFGPRKCFWWLPYFIQILEILTFMSKILKLTSWVSNFVLIFWSLLKQASKKFLCYGPNGTICVRSCESKWADFLKAMSRKQESSEIQIFQPKSWGRNEILASTNFHFALLIFFLKTFSMFLKLWDFDSKFSCWPERNCVGVFSTPARLDTRKCDKKCNTRWKFAN